MDTNLPSGALNIDQMLQSLEEQPQVLAPSLEQEVQETVLPITQETSPTLSVESLQPPVMIDVWSSQEVTQVSKKKSLLDFKKMNFSLPPWLRMGASAFLTFFVLFVGWWVVSIQYPEETNNMFSIFTGTFSTLTTNTKNNMKPDDIVVLDDDEDSSHGVADDDSYILSTPLSDAMDDALSSGTKDNQAEELFDNVLSGSDETNNIDFSTGGSSNGSSWTTSSGNQGNENLPVSNYPWDFTFPSTQTLPTVNEFQQQLSELSEQSQSAMTNLIGNNDVALAKMRVVYKNVQAISEELSSSKIVTQEKVDQYTQIKALYDGIKK